MARSKQVARDRTLPAAPSQDAPARQGAGARQAGAGMPGVDGNLTAGGARRAAGAAGNDFVADIVGGKRAAGRGGNGVSVNAEIGGNGGGASLDVSAGLRVGGVQLGGSLRIGGRGGEGGGSGAERGGRAESGRGGRDAPARAPSMGGGGNSGGGAAAGGPAGRGPGAPGGDGGGGEDVLAVGGFQMRTAGGTAGNNAPGAPPAGASAPPSAPPAGGGGAPAARPSAPSAPGGSGNRRPSGARSGGGRASASVSVGGVSISASEGSVTASVRGENGSVTANVGRDGGSVAGTANVAGATVAGSIAVGAESGAATPARAGGTTGVGAANRDGGGGSSGNAAGGARAPRGGRAAGGRAGGGGGGGGGGGSRAPAAAVSVSNTESAQGAMNELLGATPTTQVKMWTSVGGAVDQGIKKDGEAIQAAAPELHATMGGGGQQPAADERKTEVKAAQAKIDDKKLSPDAPKLTPTPTVVPAAPKLDGARAMNGVTAETPVEEKQAKAAETIRAMPTNLEGVPTSPGPAPRVPLTGDSDPAKAEANRADAESQARKGADDLRTAVETGRGPDAVQPKVFDEAKPVRKLVDAKMDATRPIDPLQKFMQLGVPADVEGAIDEQQQAVMDTALGEARGKLDEAVSTKDADSSQEIEAANTEAERLRVEADSAQDEAVGKARGEISDAREQTLVEQEKAVAQLEGEAGTRQRQEVDAIRARVSQDEAKIDDAYTKAEADVTKEIQQGEKDAEAEKKEAEEKANNRSWWDRVKDAVASAFKALTDAINAILEFVRDAVKAILDGVKKLATDLIDAASKWITDRLKAFGEWLKSQVTALLGSVFPELAKKLNGLIDAAVNYACEKVEQLATQLKEGITALCDKIAGALDAIIAAYQAAVGFALALAEAALTGNWEKVGMIVLEGILKLAGIPPEEFYAVVGKAEDTIGTIVENPGGFLGNCLDAVGQGFGQFSDNFTDHLQTGFLSWMTGTMGEAGIQMPGTFDLAGMFDLVIQVTGLTKDHLREKAVEHLGEENVERFEFVWGFIDSALQGGWGGIWEHVEGYLGGLWDEVVGTIQDYLMERVIKAAVLKIASMFSPVGAIVQAIMTAWNLYEFLRDQIQRIFGVVRAVVDSISDIANGNIGGAADMIENALGNLVPVAIDLLAKLLGLGGIGGKIKEIVGGVRAKVDEALDKMIERVKGLFKGGKKKKGKDEGAEDGAEQPAAAAAGEEGEKEGALPNGAFNFETDKLYGRDPVLGAASFSITGTARVKSAKGELSEADVHTAKGEVMKASKTAVGKAVNESGVTSVAAQLSALTEQAKIKASEGVKGAGMSLESMSITGIVLPPEVQKAIDEKAAKNIAASDEPLAFQAGGEQHRLWVAVNGGQAAVMVASTPMTVKARVEKWRVLLREKSPEERKAAGSAIGRAIALEGEVAKVAAAVDAGTRTKQDLDIKKGELAGALGELFNVLPEHAAAEALDPELTLTGANYKAFEQQFLALATQISVPNPQAEAQRVWLQVVRGLLASQEAVARADKDPKTQRTDLEDKAFREVLKTFDPVVASLAPAMRTLTQGQSTWAFWSGRPAKAMAIRSGGVSLEGSVLGKMFDEISLRATPSIQLWAAISTAYAKFAAENMEGRTYLGFVGKDSSIDQSIFNKIEQPAFNVAAEKVSFTPRITFFACAVNLADHNTPDDRFAAGGRAGAYAEGDRPSMVGRAESENKTRIAEFERLVAAGATKAEAAEAVGPGWVVGSALPGKTQPVANQSVEVPLRAGGLVAPGVVPGQLDRGGKRDSAAVGAADRDVEVNLEAAKPVLGDETRRPGAATGEGDRGREVEDGGGVGHDSSGKKSDVSKYAAGDPPAGWQSQVQTTRPAYNEPGHTDNILDDGNVVRESRPKLLKREVADGAIRSAGLSIGALKAKKKKTPEETLRQSGAMSSEEVDAMKGALKKNPRSEEQLQADGTKKAVAKPEKVDTLTGKQITESRSADGTTRAPMTEKEKEALLKGHAVLAKDNRQGADMRKIIPNNGVGGMLAGTPAPGAEKLGPSVRGSVGLQRNTEGMNAEETVSALGLDYEHNPNTDKKPAAGKKKRGAFTDMDATGKVTLGDGVERDGLHYVDFKMTKEMEQHAGVAMSQDLIDKAKASKDKDIAGLGASAHAQEKSRQDDPFAATGATSSNAMVQKGGGNAGQQFDTVLNQELNLNPRKKSAGPGEAGFELEAGAQVKKRGNKAGQDKVIATLVEKADKDGKIVKEWELDAGLEKNERGHYKNKMDHAKSEAAVKLRKPGEDDAAYDARMDARQAKIAAQQAKDEAEASANGNPFEPGTPEFKSYNRKARQKAKTKADSAEVKPVAPNGDTSVAPPVEKKPPAVTAPPAPVAAEKTEAKEATTKKSARTAPDTETAPVAQVEKAAKKDAKTPAEEVEKLLSPAAKVKPPKESKPPKDFPEPENDTVQGTTTTTTTGTTTGGAERKVAANPGLRKEHEGTGVEYTDFKGEAFVKGEGDAADIDPNDVKQGSLGDCYLLGGMAAVSRANPEHIRKLIKDNGDGTYDVTLYIKNNAWDSKGAPKVVTVDSKFPSSDKGLSAKYARYTDKGPKGPELWCMLIEKAWAVHKGTYTGIEGGKVNDDGKFAGAIALLTNLREGYYTPASIGDKQLAQMIADALSQKKPVACDSKNLDKEPPDLKAAADKAGVVGNHAYAPKSVDIGAMTIELQNPWGSSHVSGLSIADFKKFYRGLRIGS